MSRPSTRRHSITVLGPVPSFSSLSPEGGLLPNTHATALPWSLRVSEEDIPTLGKLKKIHKRERRERGSNLDLRKSQDRGSTVDLRNMADTDQDTSKRQRRRSVFVLPGTPVHETTGMVEEGRKKSKKPRRKLSFAGILPFIFNEKMRRRKSSASLEDSEMNLSFREKYKGHRKVSSTSSESSGCQEDCEGDFNHSGRPGNITHHGNHGHHGNTPQHGNTSQHANNGHHKHLLAHLKNTLGTGSHGNLRNISDYHGYGLGNLQEENNSIKSNCHGNSNEDCDTIKAVDDDQYLSSQDTLANQDPEFTRIVNNRYHRRSREDSVFDDQYDGISHQVCHHGDCLDRNAGLPLILCTECDASVHSSPGSEGHLRFDLTTSSNGVSGGGRKRHSSSQSLPETGNLPETSTSDTELEISSSRQQQDSGEDWVDGDTIRNTKLQRKKVLKVRRHNTEKEKPVHPAMMSVMHTRSHSYQEFSRIGLTDSLRDPDVTSSGPDLPSLYHGDSGVVMTSPTDSVDSKKRVFSVDSLPTKLDLPSSPATSPAYMYLDRRNMPTLDTPSPGFLSPPSAGNGGRSSPNVFILPGMDDTGYTPLNRSKRDNSAQKRQKVDGSMPHPFGRKHSSPAMLSGVSGGMRTGDKKLSLGVVENFNIHFDIVEDLIKDKDVEIVPAIKGVSLREAVSSYLEKRGLTFDMVDFFIASSQSPLQVDTADCYFLAGAELHVKAKQSGDGSFSRQVLGSQKSTSSTRSGDKRLLYSKGSRSDLTVTESNSPHGTLKGSQLKGIGKLFGVNTRKPDQLQELLQSYRHHGLPPMPELLQMGHAKFDPTVFSLENSWTELVTETESCNRYQQEAIWELLKTEVAYIKDLQFVLNLFLACLYNLQSQSLLNDVETEKIFSNIADLHQANCLFYEKHMYTVVLTARETGQPLDPTPLIQGFSQFRKFFDPYSKFCIEYMGCQQYLSRMKDDNELFRMFLNWAENQRECNRLTLRDYIGKPFQRLTKYKLLLERIWKTSRPQNVQEMISNVDQFICQVNATVTQLEIMRRIDSYDAVELPNNDALTKMVGPYCRLDLTRPIPGSSKTRFLVEEGTLKMNNRTDVICFLFTDMLLITKATSRKADITNKVKVKVYKPPMRLDKIFVNPLQDGGFMLVYLNEYNLATTAYTFHGDHARVWLDRIRQTQQEYESLRNAIMDQSEAYLLNLASGYEQYEDEYAYMNARSVAMEMGLDHMRVSRQISGSSADMFMGNIPEGRSRSTSGHDTEYHRSTSSRVTDNVRSPRDSPPSTPLVTSSSSNGATNSRFQSPQEHHSGSDSPGSKVHPHYSGSDTPRTKHPHHPGGHRGQALSDSSHFVLPPVSGHDKKVKQRRDRRYYTADMIQDMHHKDASIQKRLSWHSGNKDTDYEYRPGMGKLAAYSTDSLRSVHSSSGVSSVGSLHMNLDAEISEEITDDWGVGDMSSEDSSQASDTTTKTGIHSTGDINTSNTTTKTRIHSTGDYKHSPGDFTANDTSHTGDSNLTTHTKVSKSMPDMSRLSIVDEDGGELGVQGRDRSSTIDLIREGQQRRKLSDTQNRKLKLQILNSTLEATDV